MKFKLHLIVFLIVVAASAFGNIRLPKLVGNHMVLQRDAPVTIWGWAEVGEKVDLVMDNTFVETDVADEEGKWSMVIPGRMAGGPYQMIIKGKNVITLSDIYFGDVWVCAGQSNMEWTPTMGINNVTDEIARANFSKIRFFTVENTMSLIPKEDVQSDGWKICTPEAMKQFSAVGYFFGRELYQKYNVPIGLISADWGGSPIETWSIPASLKKLPEYEYELRQMEEQIGNPKEFESKYQRLVKEWENAVNAKDDGISDKDPWFINELKLDGWQSIVMPVYWESSVLKDFDGIVWLRKEIQLSPSMLSQDVQIKLAKIDDDDHTYFNGELIGGTKGYNKERVYTIPSRLLKSGKNTIAIRVFDTGGNGGINGKSSEMVLKFQKDSISLAGEWKIKSSVDFNTIPPYPFSSKGSYWQHCGLYNGMIVPLTTFTIKGFIWYQGESNVKNPSVYQKLFPAMINDWRAAWQNQTLPFLYVQLANLDFVKVHPSHDADWSYLREAQLKTLSLITNTGMAVAIDIGDPKDIHPQNKQEVGHRLALLARAIAYKENIVSSGPMYESALFTEKIIKIKFTSAKGLQLKKSKTLYGFKAAGEDQKFVNVFGKIEGEYIIISQNPAAPYKAVRYNWENNPNGNLYNAAGLPASPFRTDNW